MRRLLLACLLLLPAAGATADPFTPDQRREIVRIVRDALRSDPSILRDALQSLQAEEESRGERATADTLARLGPALISPADAVEGNPAGDVTMVEFYDPRCPYCRQMLPVMEALLRAEPKLKLVMKDLPILGPNSVLESRALLAAQRQGGYFKLRDALMNSNAPPTPASIRAIAERLGLDGGQLIADMDAPAVAARLDANVALARSIGLQGTPAMIVGTSVIAGATGLPELRQLIAAARAGR